MDEPHLSSSPDSENTSQNRDERQENDDTNTGISDRSEEISNSPVTLSERILITLIHFYQAAISPWLGHNCRFEPTCSNYTLEAVNEWGAFKGAWMGFRRVLRCHPWGGSGYDPVPKNSNKK